MLIDICISSRTASVELEIYKIGRTCEIENIISMLVWLIRVELDILGIREQQVASFVKLSQVELCWGHLIDTYLHVHKMYTRAL